MTQVNDIFVEMVAKSLCVSRMMDGLPDASLPVVIEGVNQLWHNGTREVDERQRVNYRRYAAEVIKTIRDYDSAIEANNPKPVEEPVAEEIAHPAFTDFEGRKLCVGDTIRVMLDSDAFKKSYWYPEYEVIALSPKPTFKYVGGGRHSDFAWHMINNPRNVESLEYKAEE